MTAQDETAMDSVDHGAEHVGHVCSEVFYLEPEELPSETGREDGRPQ